MKVAVGIDLGTAHARACGMAGTTPESMRASYGVYRIPILAAPDPGSPAGERRVGQAAMILASRSPESAVRGFTRMLGVSERSADAEELTVLVLAELAGLLAARLGTQPSGAVFSVPHWMNPRARVTLARIADYAFMPVKAMICDAAACALSLPPARSEEARIVAVVDAGAGGVGASVLEVSPARIRVHGQRSGSRGGNHIDAALVQMAVMDLGDRAEIVAGTARSLELLRQALETMKRRMTDPAVREAREAFFHGGARIEIVLGRARLEAAVEDCRDGIADAVRGALGDANVSSARVEDVYISGETSRLGFVRACVAQAFARDVSLVTVLPEGAAAMGAARHAASIAGVVREVEIVAPGEWPASAPAAAPPSESPRRHVGRAPPAYAGAPEAFLEPQPIGSRPAPPKHVAHRPPKAQPTPEPFLPPPAPRPAAAEPSAGRGSTIRPAVSFPVPKSGETRIAAPASTKPVAPAAHVASPPRAPRPAADVGPAHAGLLGQGGNATGAFVRPPDAAALVALPCARPLVARALSPMRLPVLLTPLLADVAVTGTLTLERYDGATTRMWIEHGRAAMSVRERNVLVEAFTWTEGSFRFEAGEGARPAKSAPSPVPLTEITVDGLRALTKVYEIEDIERALGSRLDQAPVPASGQADVIARMGLTGLERRLADHYLDGITAASSLLGHGRVGRHTAVGLLVLLTVFDAIEWRPVGNAETSRDAELTARAARMASANHFVALGVHWSAPQEEIDARHRALGAELRALPRTSPAARDAVSRMLATLDAAYAVLGDPHERRDYRSRVYPLDYEAVADIAEHRAMSATSGAAQGDVYDSLGVAKELRGAGTDEEGKPRGGGGR